MTHAETKTELPPLPAQFGAFAEQLRHIDWFANIGNIVNSSDRCIAIDYLANLGFSDCSVYYIERWDEADDMAGSVDQEGDWWAVESQLFEDCLQIAEEHMPFEELEVAFGHLSSIMAEVIPARLRDQAVEMGWMDQNTVDIAFGSAVRTAHMAAILLAAERLEPEHPFSLKFRLFELGHWPIGMVGRSFVIF